MKENGEKGGRVEREREGKSEGEEKTEMTMTNCLQSKQIRLLIIMMIKYTIVAFLRVVSSLRGSVDGKRLHFACQNMI